MVKEIQDNIPGSSFYSLLYSLSVTEQTGYKLVLFPFKSPPISFPVPTLDLRLVTPTSSLSDLHSDYQA